MIVSRGGCWACKRCEMACFVSGNGRLCIVLGE